MKRIFLLALAACALAGNANAALTVHQKIAAHDYGITETFELLSGGTTPDQVAEYIREAAIHDGCNTEPDIAEYTDRVISSIKVAVDRAKRGLSITGE